MTDRNMVEEAAERTWNERVAGQGVPPWHELSEAEKARWRKSFNVSGEILREAGVALTAPLLDAADRLARLKHLCMKG